MASSADSPSSAFAFSLLPADASSARMHSHGSPDVYHLGTPATPTPPASLSTTFHGHLRAGLSADSTPTGGFGMAGAQPTFPKGNSTSELYESHGSRSNQSSRTMPFQDISDDGTVLGQHIVCVSRASEERLLSTGNVAYTLAKDKIKVLTHELHTLRIEANMQRKLYEELVSKVPQLLGMVSNVDHDSLEAMAVSSVVHGRVVLGLGWVYPQPRTQPEGVTFRYWYASDYKERPNKGGKQGQHDNSVNVAQRFVEDEQGQPVSGTVAKDIREMLRSLLHSLVWSGQAAASQDHLPHEARVYIHVSLSRRFPFLLLCDGGGWKINALIKQMYHGFSGHHIKATATSHAKNELLDSADSDRRLLRLKFSTPGPSGESPKRARQSSLGADLSSNNMKPSKMPRVSPAPDNGAAASTSQTGHGAPQLTASHPSPSSGSAPVSGVTPVQAAVASAAAASHPVPTPPISPGASRGATPGRSAGQADPLTAASSSLVSVPLAGVSAATADSDELPDHSIPDTAATIADVLTGMGTASVADAHRGVSTASRSDSEPSRSGTEPQCAIHAQPSQRPEAAADIVPVKKPFALSSGSQRRSNRLVHRGQDSDLALDVQPDVLEAEGLGAAAASSTGASTDTPRVLAAPVAAKGPAAVSTVAAQRSGSKKRAPKGAIVLAKAKYKPEVISEQMLFMGRMIAADPGVTHADYMDAFKKLTSEEHEQLKKECAQERKQKRNQQDGTSGAAEP
ncbi:hypothetical protein BV20DRAFT_1055428 [Pilatotrama ljubarskyi]|nr:hypothetical protein BV20DRAFT_1055428 [Pilatotrama ljubarskyi]